MSAIPNAIIEALRKRLAPTPCTLVRQLVAAGHQAYIVGGAIRDLLLDVTPKDYDIATSATPEEIRQVFGRRRCHIIGRRFRLVHVYANGDLFEVSTFRRVPSEEERQGRHPSEPDDHIIWNDNCFGTLEDDATRRDFTANALYFDVTGSRGIIDFWGGFQDVCHRRVRCIGNPTERLEEDPVRMLRALKLIGQFGFQLEDELADAIRQMAPAIRLASTSRLFEELLKILKHPAAGQTFQVMHDYGFLKHFWPTLDESWNEQEGELARHLLKLRGEAILRGYYSNSRGLALSTVALPFLMSAMNPENPTDFWPGSLLFNPTARRALGIVFDGFKLPNAFTQRILEIVGLVPRMLHDQNRPRILQHIEYRYGRALLALLIQAFGWDGAKILQNYPEFSPTYGTWEGSDNSLKEETAPASATADSPNRSNSDKEAVNSDEPNDASSSMRPKRRSTSHRRKTPAEPESDSTTLQKLLPLVPLGSHKEETTVEKQEKADTPSQPKFKEELIPLGEKKPTTPAVPPTPQPAKPKASSRKAKTDAGKKLLPLQKDGQRVALPTAQTSADQKVGASFLPVTPPKRRSPVKSESITFSPTSQASRKKSAK